MNSITKLTTFVLLLACFHLKAQSNQAFGQAITDSIYSNVLKESREIFVKIPESYGTDSTLKYPVAFILDGENMLSTATLVHGYYSGGFMPEMILVGISNANHRTRDLTTSKLIEREGIETTEKNGEADNFVRFIEKELIPYIEKSYPVTDYRTLIGHSYGGLFAINMLLYHSNLFENYLAIDPSLDWDNQKLLKQSKGILAQSNFEGKSLFMSLAGQLHMQKPEITIENVMKDTSEYTLFSRSNIDFYNQVKRNSNNGIKAEWKFYPKDLHGTVPLPSIMDGLIAMFQWFQMENVTKFNDPETPKEELYKIIKHREEKLTNHFDYATAPYEEGLFNMLGYMSMDMGNQEKALMFFKLATEYYPESANAFDSLADYYVSQNDYNKALKHVSKAFELSGSDYHQKRIEEFKTKI